jgi:ligand-binding SRPBCC domain-containing protein
MSVFESSIVLPKPRPEVFEYLRRPANLLKMFPSHSNHSLSLKVPEVMNLGDRIEFNFKSMGHQFDFVHEITNLSFHDLIVLRQVHGPFKLWTQEQHFADSSDGATLLKTSILYEPPGGFLGFIVTKKMMHSYLQQWVPHGLELLRASLSDSPT